MPRRATSVSREGQFQMPRPLSKFYALSTVTWTKTSTIANDEQSQNSKILLQAVGIVMIISVCYLFHGSELSESVMHPQTQSPKFSLMKPPPSQKPCSRFVNSSVPLCLCKCPWCNRRSCVFCLAGPSQTPNSLALVSQGHLDPADSKAATALDFYRCMRRAKLLFLRSNAMKHSLQWFSLRHATCCWLLKNWTASTKMSKHHCQSSDYLHHVSYPHKVKVAVTPEAILYTTPVMPPAHAHE